MILGDSPAGQHKSLGAPLDQRLHPWTREENTANSWHCYNKITTGLVQVLACMGSRDACRIHCYQCSIVYSYLLDDVLVFSASVWVREVLIAGELADVGVLLEGWLAATLNCPWLAWFCVMAPARVTKAWANGESSGKPAAMILSLPSLILSRTHLLSPPRTAGFPYVKPYNGPCANCHLRARDYL